MSLRLSGVYSPTPFVVRDNQSGVVYGEVVARQATASATLAYWWHERIRLSATLPVSLYAAGERVWASPVPFSPPTKGPAQGDMSVSALWNALRLPFFGMRGVVDVDVVLPTGAAASYVSNGKVNVGATLGVAGRHGPWSYTLAVSRRGHSVRRAYQPGRRPITWMLQPGIGRYFRNDAWHVSLEVPLSTIIASSVPSFTKRNFWAPPLAAVRWQPNCTWALTLGAGTDVTWAPGAVRWRAQVALDVTPWASHRHLAVPNGHQEAPWVLAVLPRDEARATEASKPEPSASVEETQAAAPAPAPAVLEAPAGPTPKPSAVQVLPMLMHFSLESAEVQQAQAHILMEVQRHLEAHPEAEQMTIIGYTDDRGPRAYNLRLSQERADAVRRALIRLGVPAERLRAEGRGPVLFVQSNATRLGREANRRVGFEIPVEAPPSP